MAKKVLKKFRSTNTLYEDYSMDIAPMVVTGESSQTEVVSAGGGKMYLTRGEKHQSRCMHLSIDAKEKDPVRKFCKQMDDVLEQARRDGQELPQYQPIDLVGCHCKASNADSIGICYIGGLDEKGQPCDTRTYEQCESMMSLVTFLRCCFPKALIYGHRDLMPRDCPCFEVRHFFPTEWCAPRKRG